MMGFKAIVNLVRYTVVLGGLYFVYRKMQGRRDADEENTTDHLRVPDQARR